MTPDEHYSLEFVGGPYDGYLQYVEIPQGNLIETVALPVNRNVLQVIKGEPPGRESRTRSVAIYELRQVRGDWKYAFLGATERLGNSTGTTGARRSARPGGTSIINPTRARTPAIENNCGLEHPAVEQGLGRTALFGIRRGRFSF